MNRLTPCRRARGRSLNRPHQGQNLEQSLSDPRKPVSPRAQTICEASKGTSNTPLWPASNQNTGDGGLQREWERKARSLPSSSLGQGKGAEAVISYKNRPDIPPPRRKPAVHELRAKQEDMTKGPVPDTVDTR